MEFAVFVTQLLAQTSQTTQSGIDGWKVLSVLSGIAAFITLAWKLIDLLATYLQISVTVSRGEGGAMTAITTVQNKNTSFVTKKIDFAMILVGPEFEHPVETAKTLCNRLQNELKRVNDLAKLKDRGLIYLPSEQADDTVGRALIPLPFYTNENLTIGDEALAFRCSIATRGWKPGAYCCRFFLFPHGGQRLLRVTQDLFTVADPVDAGPFRRPTNIDKEGYAGEGGAQFAKKGENY